MKTIKQTITDYFFNPGWGRVEIHSGDLEELAQLMKEYTIKIVDLIIEEIDESSKEKVMRIKNKIV
jgi:hypothetical protein